MKRKVKFLAVTISAALLTGCSAPVPADRRELLWEAQNGGTGENMPDGGQTGENTNPPKEESAALQTEMIEGFVLVDGQETPVQAAISLEGIERGEDAAALLAKESKDIPQPKEGQEYIVFFFLVSYDEGEADEIYMMESRASMQDAGLYFALSNGDSNAEEVTDELSGSIYNLTIAKGESARGQVAFLHRTDAAEPLYFIGFGNQIEFVFDNP